LILSFPPLSASIETFCEYGYLLVTVYPSITQASPPSSLVTKYGSLSYLILGNIFLALSIICLFNNTFVFSTILLLNISSVLPFVTANAILSSKLNFIPPFPL
jgi:hypothetical protein